MLYRRKTSYAVDAELMAHTPEDFNSQELVTGNEAREIMAASRTPPKPTQELIELMRRPTPYLDQNITPTVVVRNLNEISHFKLIIKFKQRANVSPDYP
jgi:hypothetical protein